jgi:uncharacterized protein YecE (DUF72 family)
VTQGHRIRIGISGWRYPPWRGRFYPRDLPQRCELAFASCQVDTIEINGSFYSLQRPDSFRRWHDETPDDFVFAVKGARFITHMKRLNDVEIPLANFFASGVLALRRKLGPVLWQFPPNFAFDRDRLARFFDLLPRDTAAAARLGRRHDHRLDGRTWLDIDRKRPIRHAIEIRHDSFATRDFVRLLRAHQIALVFADSVDWPYFEDVTADFIYIRLHGSVELYASGYGDKALDRWAKRIRAWAAGGEPRDPQRIAPMPARRRKQRPVFVYFDNDAKVKAPRDAKRLATKLRD